MFEKKYRIIFVRKEYSTIYLVNTINTNEIAKSIKNKGTSYTLEIDKPAFSTEKQKIYFIDFDSGIQLKFDEIKVLLNPKELDLFVNQHIIRDLTESAITDRKEKIINMIIGAIMGALISAIIMFIYMNNQINEIYKTFAITPIQI